MIYCELSRAYCKSIDNALVSEKDMKYELLKDFDSPFSIDVDLYPEFK